jgi:hypothetical protein
MKAAASRAEHGPESGYWPFSISDRGVKLDGNPRPTGSFVTGSKTSASLGSRSLEPMSRFRRRNFLGCPGLPVAPEELAELESVFPLDDVRFLDPESPAVFPAPLPAPAPLLDFLAIIRHPLHGMTIADSKTGDRRQLPAIFAVMGAPDGRSYDPHSLRNRENRPIQALRPMLYPIELWVPRNRRTVSAATG